MIIRDRLSLPEEKVQRETMEGQEAELASWDDVALMLYDVIHDEPLPGERLEQILADARNGKLDLNGVYGLAEIDEAPIPIEKALAILEQERAGIRQQASLLSRYCSLDEEAAVPAAWQILSSRPGVSLETVLADGRRKVEALEQFSDLVRDRYSRMRAETRLRHMEKRQEAEREAAELEERVRRLRQDVAHAEREMERSIREEESIEGEVRRQISQELERLRGAVDQLTVDR